MRQPASLFRVLAGALIFHAGVASPEAPAPRARGEAQIPVCTKRLGTIAIVEPDNQWWRELNLGSPEAILKVFVQKSGCFGLVNRGASLQSRNLERAMADQGELQSGSNLGKGQVKAADYFLQPDIVSGNSNSGGNALGAIAGGLLGHTGFGAIAGGVSVKKKEANVTLSVVNARTTEEEALVEGHARKSDLSFGGGAGGGSFWGGFGGAGGGGYQNTEIGQVIVLAYLDAYTKLVTQLGGNVSNDVAISLAAQLQPAEASFIPWPPPRPSSIGEVTTNFHVAKNFGFIAQQISTVLSRRGYQGLLYFRVPGGFGITTKLERLDESGSPDKHARWSKVKMPSNGGFLEYIRNLFAGDEGHFRIFLFVISDQDLQPQSEPATDDNVKTWSQLGRPTMSRGMAMIPPSRNTRVSLLVYEFTCSHSKGGALVSSNDGGFAYEIHRNSSVSDDKGRSNTAIVRTLGSGRGYTGVARYHADHLGKIWRRWADRLGVAICSSHSSLIDSAGCRIL